MGSIVENVLLMHATILTRSGPWETEEPRPKPEFKIYSMSDFEVLGNLGSGQYGKVALAMEKKTGLRIAIKKVPRSKLTEKVDTFLLNEIVLQSRLTHPHCTRLYTAFLDPTFIYLVLEYCSNGNLYQQMLQQKFKRFPENLAAKYIHQTTDALMYCHSHFFFHGDVKPENIFVDAEGDIKLGDFGLAWTPKYNELKVERGFVGTVEYMSPEQFTGEPYDSLVDNWSVGVLCYELLVGKSPFYSKKKKLIPQNISNVKYNHPKILKEDAKDLIGSLLVYNPTDRISLDDVVNHKWVKDNFEFWL